MKPIFITPKVEAFAIVYWENRFKTICYNKEELNNALERYRTPGDFYYKKYYEVEYVG